MDSDLNPACKPHLPQQQASPQLGTYNGTPAHANDVQTYGDRADDTNASPQCPTTFSTGQQHIDQMFSSNAQHWTLGYVPFQNIAQTTCDNSLGTFPSAGSISASASASFCDTDHIQESSAVAGISYLNRFNAGEDNVRATSGTHNTSYQLWTTELSPPSFTTEMLDGVRWYICGCLDYKTTRMSGMNRHHESSRHSKEKKYLCSKCLKKFTRNDTCKRHEKLKCRKEKLT